MVYLSNFVKESGDPSKDVAVASVFFLVDGKLVLLQPSTDDEGNLRYDMRVVAHEVEFSFLARDCPEPRSTVTTGTAVVENGDDFINGGHTSQSLSDSLWLFDGADIKAWTDIQALLDTAATEYVRDVSPSITMTVDYYPLSVLLQKGIVFGIEAELSLGRDANFSIFRTVSRVCIFDANIVWRPP